MLSVPTKVFVYGCYVMLNAISAYQDVSQYFDDNRKATEDMCEQTASNTKYHFFAE